jgi:hypothetical protein
MISVVVGRWAFFGREHGWACAKVALRSQISRAVVTDDTVALDSFTGDARDTERVLRTAGVSP